MAPVFQCLRARFRLSFRQGFQCLALTTFACTLPACGISYRVYIPSRSFSTPSVPARGIAHSVYIPGSSDRQPAPPGAALLWLARAGRESAPDLPQEGRSSTLTPLPDTTSISTDPKLAAETGEYSGTMAFISR